MSQQSKGGTEAPSLIGGQEEVFAFLSDPATHGTAPPIKRIDTHAAAVFLAGPDAYKVKKAVRFPFMDQSTLERRHRACLAEIAVNRHFTPALYLGVLPITRQRDSLALDGKGVPVEWVVHMRRFDETQTLDLVAERGALSPSMVIEVGRLIAESHRRAPVRDGQSAMASLASVIEETLGELLDAPAVFPADATRALAAHIRELFQALRPLLAKRAAAGFVRRCHGDLHLRNITLLKSGPVLFDAIEFDEAIATIDIFYDLAFALMDLWERRLFSEANLLFNRYLWESNDPSGAIEGLPALPLFLSLRAAVLAKIAAIRFREVNHLEATRQEALRYFDAAAILRTPHDPVLVGVGGLSGSGKTTLAAAIAPSIGRPPGAVHLRSDILRKRRFGVGEFDRLPEAAYAPKTTDAVFADLRAFAEQVLRGGHSAVVDAVHRTQEERDLLAAVADRVGCRFIGLWLDAPMAVLLKRVAGRQHDASDATAAIVRQQASLPLAEITWRRLDAALPVKELATEALGSFEAPSPPN
jgi:aminoglycoside phosphotransferase family enzyme/predicted kinase